MPTTTSISDRARAAVDRQLAKRYLRKTGIGPATRAFADRHGLEVRRGPFAGLLYVDRYVQWSGDLIPKLLGTYEEELHPVIERWIGRGFDTFVDVGAAEGYYAVGLARAVPGARVHGFEIQDYVNGMCAEMAQANGVGDRVELAALCTHDHLEALTGERTAILLDCEGCEDDLLRPERVPGLGRSELLVELHDDVRAGVSDTVIARLADTHEVTVIEQASRDPSRHPELADLDPQVRDEILGELRPEGVRWGHFIPRG